jgi:hypothetical protein
VVLPQLTMRGLSGPWDMICGVVFSGLFSVMFSRMLSRHIDDDVELDAEPPKAATSKTSPFAVAAQ